MKVAVVGSRDLVVLLSLYVPLDTTEIISGGARGVDACARRFAERRGLKYREFLPEYQKYGKKAPLVRNDWIIAEAELVLVFWDGRSRGTKYVIDRCLELGKPAHIFIMP